MKPPRPWPWSPQYRCDVCDRPKLQANHWFTAQLLTVFGFSVQPWNDDEARIAPIHLCSQECVHKLLNSYLSIGVLREEHYTVLI